MKILIAGCGDVGAGLAAELVADGHQVWALRRRVEALQPLRALGVVPVGADLSDSSSFGELPSELHDLVYVAAASARTEEAYEDAYVRGLSNLLDHYGVCKTSDVIESRQGLELKSEPRLKRIIFVSSTAVYGQDDGSWVDESSPTDPSSFTGACLLRAEALLDPGRLAAGTEGVVLRLAGIYGPGRLSLIRRLADGRISPGGERGRRYTNRIHRDDCVGALAHLLTLDNPAPVYLGVDADPATFDEVTTFLSGEMGLSLEQEPASDQRERPAPASPQSESKTLSSANKRCTSKKLIDSGYRLRVPSYRVGYRGLVEAWRGSQEQSGG